LNIRYGIIGTGMMGCEHIRNLERIKNVDITAIADPNEKSRKWGIKACGDRFKPKVFEKYTDLLKSDEVDAVIIASPNFTHIDVMREVFKTDKHVLLEKPMCTNISDAEEVVFCTRKHKGIVWVGLEYRFMAPINMTLQLSKSIGNIRMFSIREHRFPFLKKVDDWNRFNRNTGGTLIEKCCHFFDLMNLVIPSKPIRVFASGGQNVNHLDEIYNGEVPDILDNAYVIVDFESGERALLDLCMFAEGGPYEQQITLTGEQGRIETTIPGDELIISQRSNGGFKKIPINLDSRVREVGFHHGASYLEHLGFIDSIINHNPPLVTVDDGLMSIVLGVAAQQSIKTGLAVEINSLL
jgi:predicted dehydrogenase